MTQEVAEFEKSLPSSFRERMARIMYLANGVDLPAQPGVEAAPPTPLSQEQDARRVLFPSSAFRDFLIGDLEFQFAELTPKIIGNLSRFNVGRNLGLE